VEIREVHGYEALARWVEVRNSVFPHDPDSTQVLALARAREANHVNLLALVDGEVVGVGMLGDDPGTRASTHAYVEVGVVPGHRGRGVGTALFRDLSRRVLGSGYEGLECEALVSDTRSLEWLTSRGFRELRRHTQLVLEADDAVGDAPVPAGLALHAVGLHPELIRGMFAVAEAAYAELPSPRSGQAGTFTAWQVYELGAEGLDLELSLVAERDGEVQGYSTVTTSSGSDDVLHRMTCVLPAAGAELAAALVREQVVRTRAAGRRRFAAWALTSSMEEVFSQLGFRAGEVSATLRGPLL
jgi:ribosomal protein S18 acetylase RimI-like enzyme